MTPEQKFLSGLLHGISITLIVISVPYLWGTPNPIGFFFSVPSAFIFLGAQLYEERCKKKEVAKEVAKKD